MAEYYDALKAKWPELTGSPDERLKAVNELMVSQEISIAAALAYLRAQGAWVGIKLSAKPAGQALADILTDTRLNSFDPTAAWVIQMGADLIGEGALTKEQWDALAGKAAKPLPWWQVNSYPRPFDMGDIKAAGLL